MKDNLINDFNLITEEKLFNESFDPSKLHIPIVSSDIQLLSKRNKIIIYNSIYMNPAVPLPSKKVLLRKQYLNNLKLQASNDLKSYNATKVFDITGQLPLTS